MGKTLARLVVIEAVERGIDLFEEFRKGLVCGGGKGLTAPFFVQFQLFELAFLAALDPLCNGRGGPDLFNAIANANMERSYELVIVFWDGTFRRGDVNFNRAKVNDGRHLED